MTSDTLQAVIGEKILAVKQRFSERVINIELEVRFNVTAELFFGSFQDVCSFAHVFPRYEQTIVCVDNSDSRRMRSEYTATQPPIFIQSTAKLRLMPSTDLPTKFGNMRVDVQEETVTQDLVAMGNFFRMRERCTLVMCDCPDWKIFYTRVINNQDTLAPAFEIEIELLKSIDEITSRERMNQVAQQCATICKRMGAFNN